MREVFRDHAARISKGELGFCERGSVLLLVLPILLRIPLEPGLCHHQRLARIWLNSHIFVWVYESGVTAEPRRASWRHERSPTHQPVFAGWTACGRRA